MPKWKQLPVKPGARPSHPNVVQIECVEFDIVAGLGQWALYHNPGTHPSDVVMIEETSWERYERKARRVLHMLSYDEFEHAMTYMSNFQVININIKTHEMWPVIPRPRDEGNVGSVEDSRTMETVY